MQIDDAAIQAYLCCTPEPARNLIERFFNRLKHARRIATRFEKHAVNFLAAVQIVAILIWARFESTT